MENEISKYQWMEILKEKYNLDAKKIEKNQQSTDHNVYEIYGNTKKYIAKIYHSRNHTKCMANLHNKLSQNFGKKLFSYLFFFKRKTNK